MRLRYITGRGGSSTQGLSAHLKQQADDFAVLANDSELHKLSLDEQLSVVTAFSSEATHLIANSYGAYLWLLTRIDAAPSDTRVLLLSPVMGRAVDPEKMLSSRPPRLRGLERAISEGRVNLPTSVSVRTGQDDPVCDFQTAVTQCERLGVADIEVLHGESHNLRHLLAAQIIQYFIGGKFH
jgi:hypothetical protein